MDRHLSGFFRRSIQKQIEYRCLRDGKCMVIRLNRNRCQFCRFKKCLAVGMSRDSVRYGRVPKRSRERVDDVQQPTPTRQSVNNNNNNSNSNGGEPVGDDSQNSLALYDVVLTVAQAHHAHCAYTEEKRRQTQRRPALVGQQQDNDMDGGVDSIESQKLSLWTCLAQLVTPSIQRIVEFAKRLPNFLTLSQDDQLILVKLGFFEVWTLHVHNSADDETLTLSDGSFFTRHQLELMFDREFVASLFGVWAGLKKLQLSDTETALFAAVVLLQSDRAGLFDVKTIDATCERLLEALRLQLSRSHDATAFQQVIQRLHDLKALGQAHAQHLCWFRARWTRLSLPPLFAEIFDLPKGGDC